MTDAAMIKLHAQMSALERLVALADTMERNAREMLTKGDRDRIREWSAQLREEHRILTNQPQRNTQASGG